MPYQIDPGAPLPSWHEGETKEAILDFVAQVTQVNGAHYVPPAERIAVFDNDGTLWCEKPMYIQLDYILRRLAAQAAADASLRARQPWKAAYEQDFTWLGGVITKHYQGDDRDLHTLLGGILKLSHDQPVEQVEADAKAFVEREVHPTLGRRYADCVYQPMLELLHYLNANGFTNYIVSGGGRDFMRGITADLYGIPRERVIGSTVAYRYVEGDGTGAIVQQAELDVADDGPAKPIQIWNVIGRRPILAAGNSNGDLPMLQFTGGNALPGLRLLIRHDDAAREFDYVAGAERVLDAADAHGWLTVSMQRARRFCRLTRPLVDPPVQIH
jgi:phosphoglycolate phosphatase-like HAD superfamily hydrolase